MSSPAELTVPAAEPPRRPWWVRGMAAGVAACLISSLLPLLVALAAIAGYDYSGVNATPWPHAGGSGVAALAVFAALIASATVGVVVIRRAAYQRLARARVGWGPAIVSSLVSVGAARLHGPEGAPAGLVLLLASAFTLWGWSATDERFAGGARPVLAAAVLAAAALVVLGFLVWIRPV